MAKTTKTDSKTKTKVTKKTKDKSGPKKNKSSYMFFCEEERKVVKEELPDLSNKDVLTELGARWKKLKESNSDNMKHYEELAVKDKERYLSEKESKSVEESDETEEEIEEKPKKAVSKKTTIKEKKSESTEEESEKPEKKVKVNSYIIFCKATRAEVKAEFPDLEPKEITRKLAEKWKSLSDDEKQKFKN
jgi:hypothetical protein